MSRSRHYPGRRDPEGLSCSLQRACRREQDARGELFAGLLEYGDHCRLSRCRDPRNCTRRHHRWVWDMAGLAASARDVRPRRRVKTNWFSLPGSPVLVRRVRRAYTLSGVFTGYWIICANGRKAYTSNGRNTPIAGGDWLRVPPSHKKST